MTKPIVPHRSRTIFEGRIFTLSVESITLPRGDRLDAEILRHPGSVVLIPVTDVRLSAIDDGQYALVTDLTQADIEAAQDVDEGFWD